MRPVQPILFPDALGKAIASREFDDSTNAYRLLNGAADGTPEITLDKLNDVLVLNLYEQQNETKLIDDIIEICQPQAIYIKRRPREAKHLANISREDISPLAPVWGAAKPEVLVQENKAQYLIRPGADLSVGLFLDMRDTRTWLAGHAKEKTVLNCFAYTCAFGVVASLGAAARVLNLDLSRKVLDWGEENYRLNNLPTEKTNFLSGDVFDWLMRFEKRKQTFEVVILDPPSFARSEHFVFSAAQNYDQLVQMAAATVAPGGTLLACCNMAGFSPEQFASAVLRGLRVAGRRAEVLAELSQSAKDFPVLFNTEPPLKVLAFKLE